MTTKLTDKQALTLWSGLEKKHAGERAEAVMDIAVGRSMKEISDLLGYGRDWVREQLDRAGIDRAIGGPAVTPLTGGTRKIPTRDLVSDLIIKHKPLENDSEDFETFVKHYADEGHDPDIANRLAKANWAGEVAIETGEITEAPKQRAGKVKAMLITGDAGQFKLRLQSHMASVRSAARFLDEAKISDLKLARTKKRLRKANANWMEQMERIENFHPGFMEEDHAQANG